MPDNSTESPLLVDAPAAARLLGIGKSLFWSMHSSGRLGPLPIRLGRRTLWRKDELTAWIKAGCPARDQWQTMREEVMV